MDFSSFLSEALKDPWGAVVGIWKYLMDMPMSVAIGLTGATLLLFIVTCLVFLVRKPNMSLPVFLIPILAIAVVMAVGTLSSGATSGFFANVVRFFAFVGFLWGTASLLLTFTLPGKPKKQ